MIIQNRDDLLTEEPGRHMDKRQSYYAMVPAGVLDCESIVIDELISFAFDTLGAWRLDVRVYDEAATKALVEGEPERQKESSAMTIGAILWPVANARNCIRTFG